MVIILWNTENFILKILISWDPNKFFEKDHVITKTNTLKLVRHFHRLGSSSVKLSTIAQL